MPINGCFPTGAAIQALGLLLVAGGCSANPAEAAHEVTHFKCAGELAFQVDRNEKRAIVIYSGVRYELPRRPSSIGQRYASSGAALIIDGDMAAFASGTVLNLNFCRATGPGTES